MKIIDVINEALVGKKFKICIYNGLLLEPKKKYIPREGATKQQITSDPDKFLIEKDVNVSIGSRKQFVTLECTKVSVSNYHSDNSVKVSFPNDFYIVADADTLLNGTLIEKDVFYLKPEMKKFILHNEKEDEEIFNDYTSEYNPYNLHEIEVAVNY